MATTNTAYDWRRRIAGETGMSVEGAVALLAARGHSKRGAAQILGIAYSTFLRNCEPEKHQWVNPYDSIEFREAVTTKGCTAPMQAHIDVLQKKRQERCQHEVRGVQGTLTELAQHFGAKVSLRTLHRRINDWGWDVERAVTTDADGSPLRRGNKRRYSKP